LIDRNRGEFGTDIPMSPEEKFVNDVYASADDAASREMDRLRSQEGIVPMCKLGCCCCCRCHILTNPAEAHTLVQYLKREFSLDQMNDLQLRTRQWHAWDNSRPGRYPAAIIDAQADFSGYEHCCPLLVDQACSAYPVRPIMCRAHYVSSDPEACCAANDPESTEAPPVVLRSVVAATTPFSSKIRHHIETAGLDFSRSIMLLPHYLAIEMGWDFAVA